MVSVRWCRAQTAEKRELFFLGGFGAVINTRLVPAMSKIYKPGRVDVGLGLGVDSWSDSLTLGLWRREFVYFIICTLREREFRGYAVDVN